MGGTDKFLIFLPGLGSEPETLLTKLGAKYYIKNDFRIF